MLGGLDVWVPQCHNNTSISTSVTDVVGRSWKSVGLIGPINWWIERPAGRVRGIPFNKGNKGGCGSGDDRGRSRSACRVRRIQGAQAKRPPRKERTDREDCLPQVTQSKRDLSHLEKSEQDRIIRLRAQQSDARVTLRRVELNTRCE